MTDAAKTPVCMQCGATSNDNVLIQCLKNGDEDWVCVSCLPILIHGGH